MIAFDYSTEAELFTARSRRFGGPNIGYRRFARAADAIRFAIEDLPPALLAGAYLEVDEERFDRNGIRGLYNSADYPLARRAHADNAPTHDTPKNEVLKADPAPRSDASRTRPRPCAGSARRIV